MPGIYTARTPLAAAASGHPHQCRAGDYRERAQPYDVDALSFDGRRVLAHHSQRKPERRPIEHPGERGHERQREPRQRRLRRQHRDRHHRHFGERLDRRGRGHVRKTDAISVVSEARREQRDAQAGNMLRQGERHGEECVQQAESGARDCGDSHAAPQSSALVDGEPACERAGHHDSLDAEIQHACAFAQQHAKRAEDQRRRDAQHRRPELSIGDERNDVDR